VNAGLAAVVLGVIAVAVPLTLHTIDAVEEEQLRLAVSEAVADWDPSVRIVDLEVGGGGGHTTIELSLAGPNPLASPNRLATLIGRRHGNPIDLTVSHTREETAEVAIR
jgi:hypothetical protein